MTSKFEDFVGAVKDSLETLANSRALTAQAKSALAEAEASLTAVSRGSTGYKLTVTKEALAAAIDSLGKTETAKAAALKQFGEYLSDIGASGTTSSPSSDLPPQGNARQPSTLRRPDGGIDYHNLAKQLGLLDNRSDDSIPDFNPRQRNPVCFQGLGPYREVDTAEGNLFYPDGRRWNTEPIRASQANAGTNSGDLKPEFRQMRVVWHVEGAVAAWMREVGVKEMALYINTDRCRYSDGCFWQLHKLLPSGTRLHLQGIGSNGKPWKTTITGTGEAIG